MTNSEFVPIEKDSDMYIETESNEHMLNKEEIKHETMFGKQVRVGIIGPSGSGKSTLLKEFIKKVDMFQYTKIIIYAALTTLKSGLYQSLKDLAPDVVSLVPILLIKPLEETNLDPNEKYFIIFDDISF